MYLKKESILEFVPKKVDFIGQFSPETTTEMTYTWQCELPRKNVASDLRVDVLHRKLSTEPR